ncbi:MAG: 1-acyl-sn-glycerol-3-phosphate acyltransferase [Cyanobacteria bacterium]|nr:1-acyl-sn-glycerol-3-phosphate acyltransferase [Cyanobacteriota bacterium]MDW8201772.1 lysophospholipid acyltransferase family protein [Cyanobacteriota bacterium SKYGB_h_bin112]
MKFRYTPFPDVGKPLVQQLGMYPRVPDFTWDFLRWLGRWMVVLLFHLQYRLEVRGTVPDGDKIALVANHQSHLDTPTVLAALPCKQRHKLCVLAAEDYFFQRVDRALAASLLGQAVAFNRNLHISLRDWMTRLRSTQTGWMLLYPSGSRKATEIQAGMLKLLLKTGWTIVPVHLEGTAEAWSIHDQLWKPFRTLRITFLPAYTGDDIDQLMQRLEQELTSPQQV